MTVTSPVVISGFCNSSWGADSHGRCRKDGCPCACHAEVRRLSRMLWSARESLDMLADLVEISLDEPDTNTRELIAEIDAYRTDRGWSPNGFGGETS